MGFWSYEGSMKWPQMGGRVKRHKGDSLSATVVVCRAQLAPDQAGAANSAHPLYVLSALPGSVSLHAIRRQSVLVSEAVVTLGPFTVRLHYSMENSIVILRDAGIQMV